MANVTRIEPTHPRYDEIYTQWEHNGSPGQFDMIIYDDTPDAQGGALFRAMTLGGVVYFFQEASEQATEIPGPEDKSRLDPHWSFASIRYRGEYAVRSSGGMPGLRYQKLINDLSLE